MILTYYTLFRNLRLRPNIDKVYKSEKSCGFMVTKQSEVLKIIDIFTKYSLNSSKYLNFVC